MIDLGFLIGYAFGCICTAALCWWGAKRCPRWHDPISTGLGIATRAEIADLAVSAGAFVSSVRAMRRQIDLAHRTLKDSTR